MAARKSGAVAPKQRGEPVVRRVLEETLQELSQVGFAALSVEQVAERAEVNKTSIYRRWPTKVELVRAALSSSMPLVPQPPGVGSLRGDLLEMLHNAAGFLTSPAGSSVVRMAFADGMAGELGGLKKAMLEGEDMAALRAVFRRAEKRGELHPGWDPELVLFTAMGSLLHRIFIERRVPSVEFLDRLVDLLLHGVQHPPGAAPRGRRPRG